MIQCRHVANVCQACYYHLQEICRSLPNNTTMMVANVFFGNMEPAKLVKSLSVTLDADNLMQRLVANLCHVCYYHFWELWRV